MTDRLKTQRLFLYDEGDPSPRDFIDLSVEQLKTLTEFVDGHGFYGEAEEVLALAGRMGLSYEKTLDLLQLASFLEGERTRLHLAPEDMLSEYATYLDRHNWPELHTRLRANSDALKRLFSDRPEVRLRQKVETVTQGIVPVATDFYSLCDLRPVFNEERDSILEYSMVALIRVLVRSDTQQIVPLIFQIDRKGISQLEEFVARLRKKMTVLEQVRKELMERKNEPRI
jgi:hypothetical protein